MKTKIVKLVLWNVAVTSKKNLFTQVAELMYGHELITSQAVLRELLEQREQAGSTMVDQLLAIPHAQSDDIKKNTLVLVHTEAPINGWDSENDAQNFVFCCIRQDISPEDSCELVATIKLAASENVQKAYMKNSKNEVIKLLKF